MNFIAGSSKSDQSLGKRWYGCFSVDESLAGGM